MERTITCSISPLIGYRSEDTRISLFLSSPHQLHELVIVHLDKSHLVSSIVVISIVSYWKLVLDFSYGLSYQICCHNREYNEK
jgi:hypothetical protein